MNSSSPLPTGLPVAAGIVESFEPLFNYTGAGIVCLVGFIIYQLNRSKNPYNDIPAVGRTGFFSSYVDAIRFLKHANEMLQDGYNRYHPGVFRVPELHRWHVVVAGEKFTEELRKAPEDTLSFEAAINDVLAVEWTLGPNVAANQYHVPVLRNQLTRNLSHVFQGMHEEITLGFQDYIPATEDWSSVKALETVMKIISRTSNRIFFGETAICRDPEYISLTSRFAFDVVIGAKIISLFPDRFKPLAGRCLTNVPKSIELAIKHLRPVIAERQRQVEEYGRDYPGKPLDVLSWLMDEALDEECTVENLTLRILALNFAAISTTSMTFTHALFELASRPEYIPPIREEVEAVVAEHGWSKVAMTHMQKLDSFIKESQRYTSLVAMDMPRYAMKDFTFSDGTRIPKGTFMSVSIIPRHMDNDVYPDARTFQGFRFSDMRQKAGEGTKNQMSTTSPDFLSFAHGRHSCPARFFAANEMKAMMAHIVLMYDLKMVGVARTSWFGVTSFPDEKAEVSFRKRRS